MTRPSWDLEAYRRRLREALDNDFLGETLGKFNRAYREGWEGFYAGEDFAQLKAAAAGAKDDARGRLLELFAQFKEKAEAAGAKVHLAATAAEANRLILDIAQETGSTRIVKSKSMTCEETELNPFLEREGIEVTETDLGEWIVQLRKERPSHLLIPAVHLSRAQIAELFEGVTGETLDRDDIQGLVRVARRELRARFLAAQMGITGANFALASTGTLGMVANEGNIRLCTTWPPVHVALVGLDKLIPDLKAALSILKVLPRNATGQVISSYVTWVTGANPTSTGPEGVKDLRIIFLDNGRLALAEDPILGEALRCVRCGGCANVCPVYSRVGGHNYGHVYVGAIGLILTLFYHGRQHAQDVVQNCLNCMACRTYCPVGIDLPRLIKEVYALVTAGDRRTPTKHALLKKVLPNRRLFHFLLRRARLAQKPLADDDGMIRHLPRFFTPEHSFRSLPPIAARPLRDRWPAIRRRPAQVRHKVALFAGCLIDFVYPHTAEAAVDFLTQRGVALDFDPGQTCCGLPAAMLAEDATAREVARQNVEALDAEGHDHVLTLCASCASFIREHYPRLLGDEPGIGIRARQLASRVIDFSSFVNDVLGYEGREGEGPVTAYHAPCHLCRGLDVHAAPRELLKKAGLKYVPLADEEVCCGFGGTYSASFPEVSGRILRDKLAQAEEAGATQMVTDCPGCVLQLRGGADRRGAGMKVKHMAEVLAERE